MQAQLPGFVAALTSADGILASTSPPLWPAAWRAGESFGEGPLTVGAVFADLLEGVSALQAAADQHGARMYVRLHEAPDDEHDPLAYLRPSTPPPTAPRFDVVLTDAGDNRPTVVAALFETLGLYEGDARKQLMTLPCTLARAVSMNRAEAAAASLRRAGAAVDLVRNDG